MHSISKIFALWAAASLSLTVAMPAAGNDGNLTPRDFSILITDTQDRVAPHRVEEACDDAKCNELCYQRGGFVGGTCGDSGKCDCVEPSSGAGLRAQGAAALVGSISVAALLPTLRFTREPVFAVPRAAKSHASRLVEM
ncbi:MAG: hypothetical protein HETSPECPRED_008321 [Heterodermia speciosa]|uniref:Invertebrate defensins family profile domain-containing protein n=1 Tax=Heterodermia speciosa TaxID=116794 RepID=A0A8H3FZZ1_9LECA|nr:MAG: hypothetical protein HETSPECPRED_008321 [Heterodermia speciosa]